MTEAHRPTRRSARLLALSAAVSAATVAAPFSGVASAATTQRLEASDNVTAAIAWSQFSFADGSASTALLARDDVFADSLASGAAQGALDAPLLLTSSDVLDPRTLMELQRLGAERVIILGGPAAVTPTVQTMLETTGFAVERLSGPTRVETAIAVAQRVFGTVTNVVIARGYGDDADPTRAFADSLATGAYAAATKMPVLFTNTEQLPDILTSFLQSQPLEFAAVAGGTDAVSDAVASSVQGILDANEAQGEVQRLSGSNRFGTAVAMNADAGEATAGRANRVILIEGQAENAWASGFPAAIQSAGGGVPFVLANGDALPEETRTFLADADGRVDLVCGPFTSAAACDAASAEMGA